METTATVAPDQVPVTLVTDDGDLPALGAELRAAAAISLDTETVIERDEEGKPLPRDLNVDADGEGPGEVRVVSLALRRPDGTISAYVLDMGYLSHAAVAATLFGLRFFMWNAPFDRLVMRRVGVDLDAWDLMLAEAIERTGAGGGEAKAYASLAKAARKWLGYDMDGKKSTRLDYRPVSERPQLTDDEVTYAGVDAVVTLMLAPVLGGKLKEAGLTDTFVRDCNGQPFISGMATAGLPADLPGYTKVVEAERRAANVAAEQVALLTTGREMLETLAKWGQVAGKLSGDGYDQDATLALLHDADTFAAFLADVRKQRDAATNRIGALLGQAAVVDMFADEDTDATFVPLPFDTADDVSVRRWLTKTVPHFAAATALAGRDEGNFADLVNTPAADVLALAGRRKALTKDHDLDDVLAAARPGVADVTDTVAGVAVELAALRRYSRILQHYGDAGTDAGHETFLVPTWDLASAPQAKAMFNQYCPDLVEAYFERTTGTARLFEKVDSVDGDALKMIGGDLASAMLEWRKRSKIVSTYGDELLRRANRVTGRVHARYNQSLTGTGRLSSYAPNAQNLSPLVKPYIRPEVIDGIIRRVLVCVDLSQAELRFVADAAQDEEMLSAFRSGEDLHERTAALMFHLDMKTLATFATVPVLELAGRVEGIDSYVAAEQAKVTLAAEAGGPAPEPLLGEELYKLLRGKAKSVAFGYAYGLKGASLARQLTVNGVPTTKEEADALLEAFDQAYPQLAAWMAQRVAFIETLAGNMRSSRVPSGVDFAATWLLHNTHAKSHSAYAGLSKTLERTPTPVELAERLKPSLVSDQAELDQRRDEIGEEAYATAKAALDAERDRVATLAGWALNHDHAVVLRPDGTPWEFESRTAGGRRRRFQIATKRLMMSVAIYVARANNESLRRVRDGWVEVYNDRKAAEHASAKEQGKARGEYKPVTLVKDGKSLSNRELEKVFEEPTMRDDFVAFLLATLPARDMERVWRTAMADRIRAAGNQYRNHPIQGGVADAVMVAFGDIHVDLRDRFPTARGIQSVHDSIVVECDVAEAAEIRDLVVKRMQDALASFCPTVPCVADGDIHLSLSDKTKLSAEQLEELIELAAAA